MIVESFARFLLRQVDLWQSKGFTPIAADYLARLTKDRPGDTSGLDAQGDLLTRGALSAVETRKPFLAGLKAAAWLDRETGGPRL